VPISEKQFAANRANAAKITGPRRPFALEQMKSHPPKIVATYVVEAAEAPTACTAAQSKNSTVSNGYGLNSQTNPFWRSNHKKTNEFAPQSTNPFQSGGPAQIQKP
jgi:hypothetical protein